MNRLVGILGAAFILLLCIVPAVAAASPSTSDNHVLVNTGGDITLGPDQRVDFLVVVNGTATILGEARGVVVINGTANFVGGHAIDVLAVRSAVNVDAAATVSGTIHTIDSTVRQAAGATAPVNVSEGLDVAGAAIMVASALFLAYLGFAIAAIVAALALAAFASRQVRAAGSLISHEAATALLAGLGGLMSLLLAGVVAIVTILGIPTGLSILVGVLPVLLVAGYLVAGIWIGDRIVGRAFRDVPRDRPYLAAVVGVLTLDVLSIVPILGGFIAFVGFGAIVLSMWRGLRRRGESATASRAQVAVAAAS